MGKRACVCLHQKKDAAAYVNAICNIFAQFYELTMISFSVCLTASLCACVNFCSWLCQEIVCFIYFMAAHGPTFSDPPTSAIIAFSHFCLALITHRIRIRIRIPIRILYLAFRVLVANAIALVVIAIYARIWEWRERGPVVFFVWIWIWFTCGRGESRDLLEHFRLKLSPTMSRRWKFARICGVVQTFVPQGVGGKSGTYNPQNQQQHRRGTYVLYIRIWFWLRSVVSCCCPGCSLVSFWFFFEAPLHVSRKTLMFPLAATVMQSH